MSFFAEVSDKEGYFFSKSSLPTPFSEIAKVVVRVERAQVPIGSGFLVQENGRSFFMSAFHCFDHPTFDVNQITLTFPGDITHPILKDKQILLPKELYDEDGFDGDVIAFRFDLAESIVPPFLTREDPSTLALNAGQSLIAMGYPYDYLTKDKRRRGPVASIGRLVPRRKIFPHQIRSRSRVDPGMSGGPLINDRGEVCGIITQSESRYTDDHGDPFQGLPYIPDQIAIANSTALLVKHGVLR